MKRLWVNTRIQNHIVDKIVQGRLDKFYSENSLLEQNFVKDPDKTVQDVLTDIIAKLGENVAIKRFNRFQLGESFQSSSNSKDFCITSNCYTKKMHYYYKLGLLIF